MQIRQLLKAKGTEPPEHDAYAGDIADMLHAQSSQSVHDIRETGVGWHRGAVGRVSDLRSRGHGFDSRPGTRRENSGQVSHIYMPLFTKQYTLVPA